MTGKVARYLFSRHAPVRLCWPLAAHELRWMMNWRRACELDTYLANRAACSASPSTAASRLHQLTEDLQLEYDRSTGYMVLLRSEKDRKLVQPGLQVLRDAGVKFQEVDAEQARALEPALNPDTRIRRRGAPAGRRGRQLPPVRAAAEEPDAGAGRALRVQLLGRPAGSGAAHAAARDPGRRRAPRRHASMPSSSAAAWPRPRCCGRWACACRWPPCTAIRSARRSASR